MIIDAHTHAYGPEDLAKLSGRLELLDGPAPLDSPHRWRLVNDGGLKSLIKAEDAAGVDRFVLLPVATRPERVAELNTWTAEAARAHPAIIPFACLHPLAEDPAADLAAALADGAKGIKFHSLLQRYDLLAEASLRTVEAVHRAGLPILLDTLYGPGLLQVKPHLAVFESEFAPFGATPGQVAELARLFPDLPIVAAHLGGLYGWGEVPPLYRLDNVYLDLSYIHPLIPAEEVTAMIRLKGADKVLWGTDTPWRAVGEALAWFMALDLAAEEKDLITGRNAARLLGL